MAWTNKGTIQGDQGIPGTDGTSIYADSGAPVIGGSNGDIYLDTDTGQLYEYSGGWVAGNILISRIYTRVNGGSQTTANTVNFNDSSRITFTNSSSSGITSYVADIASGSVSSTYLGGDITTAGKTLVTAADASAQRTALGLGTAATQNTGAFEASGSVATHSALTSGIHGITSYGSQLTSSATASGARTVLGLGTSATYSYETFRTPTSGSVFREEWVCDYFVNTPTPYGGLLGLTDSGGAHDILASAPYTGIFGIQTGTGATGRRHHTTNLANMGDSLNYTRTFRASIRLIDQTWDGTREFQTIFGFGNSLTATPTHGHWFELTVLSSGVTFQARSLNSTGSSTAVTLPNAANYAELKIIQDRLNGATFYIDNVLVATHAVAVTGSPYFPMIGIRKISGTGATKSMYIDYFHLLQERLV